MERRLRSVQFMGIELQPTPSELRPAFNEENVIYTGDTVRVCVWGN